MKWTKGTAWFVTSRPYQISKAKIKGEVKYSLWLLPDTLLGIFPTSTAAVEAAKQDAKCLPTKPSRS